MCEPIRNYSLGDFLFISYFIWRSLAKSFIFSNKYCYHKLVCKCYGSGKKEGMNGNEW